MPRAALIPNTSPHRRARAPRTRCAIVPGGLVPPRHASATVFALYLHSMGNENFHREDGLAFESADGGREWWLNAMLHREDGPAVEHADGTRVAAQRQAPP